MVARQTQIILCTVHHIAKEYPQTHFAVHLLLLSKVQLHCLEISGFKLPAVLLWRKAETTLYLFSNPITVIAYFPVSLIICLCLNVNKHQGTMEPGKKEI